MARTGWWTIPGPSGFVSEVVQTTIEKTVCLLYLPEHIPEGLAEAVDSQLANRLDASTVLVDANGSGNMDPGEALLRLKLGVATPESTDYIGELLRSKAFVGRAYWLEGLDEHSWPHWRSFLDEYVRRLPHASMDCGYFIVALTPASLDPGFAALDAANGDPHAATHLVDIARIGTHIYSRVVLPEDMLFYASQRLVDIGWTPRTHLERSIVVAIVAAVAGCDPLTCDAMLATGSANVVCAPTETLRSLRISLGWDQGAEISWASGSRTWRSDGRQLIHAAFGDARGSVDELVWRGQVAVLMPLLEVSRRQYAEKYMSQMSPEEVAGRHNGDLTAAIEFGDIIDILGRRRLGDAEYRHLWDLRRLRNDVAHARPVSFQRIEECLEAEG